MFSRLGFIVVVSLLVSSCASVKSSVHPHESKAFTPAKILPAGVDSTVSTNPYTLESGEVRKGSFAATVNNVALLNKMLPHETAQDAEDINDILASIKALLPSLRVVGMFDLFTTAEWLSTESQTRSCIGWRFVFAIISS